MVTSRTDNMTISEAVMTFGLRTMSDEATISPRPTEIETSLLATRPKNALGDALGFEQNGHRATCFLLRENSPPPDCPSPRATKSPTWNLQVTR